MKPIHNFFSFLPINGKPSKEPTIVVFVGSYSCMLCTWYQLSKEHTADAMDLPGSCPLKIIVNLRHCYLK